VPFPDNVPATVSSGYSNGALQLIMHRSLRGKNVLAWQ